MKQLLTVTAANVRQHKIRYNEFTSMCKLPNDVLIMDVNNIYTYNMFDIFPKFRKIYYNNCLHAAYELKKYYSEHLIDSFTLCLKKRSNYSITDVFPTILIEDSCSNRIKEYSHHFIEVFEIIGEYYVWDILHSDKIYKLRDYLTAVSIWNNCRVSDLRYDVGFLYDTNIDSDNLVDLEEVLYILNNKIGIGKPQINIIMLPNSDMSDGLWLSDDFTVPFNVDTHKYDIMRNMSVAIRGELMKDLIKLNQAYVSADVLGVDKSIVRDKVLSSLNKWFSSSYVPSATAALLHVEN